jgi:hypothetical protein
MGILGSLSTRPSLARSTPKALSRRPLSFEQLETRLVPSASGNAWPNPNLVTISFVPDGTIVGAGPNGPIYSNLFAAFNAKWPTAVWQAEIIKAAQVWAQQTNLNFTIVSDDGLTSGTGLYQQGDPGMGDIRIGGYNMANSWLGGAYMPPPENNYDMAGDINFNTGQNFNINSTYDLQTVAMHEFGHSVGLNESTVSNAVMYQYYNGVRRSLSSDDIMSVQSIYGPRSYDAYNAVLPNNSLLTATPLTPLIDPLSLTASVNNLSITTTSQKEYFSFIAPLTTSGSFTVNVQSSGLSLLRPSVTIYAADQVTVLATANSGTVYNGATLSLTVNGVTAGGQYYIKVGGYDTTAFATGAYALTLNLGTGPSPTVPLPNTQVLDGNPLTGGGGVPMEAALDLMSAGPGPGQPGQQNGNGHDKDDKGTQPGQKSDTVQDLLSSTPSANGKGSGGGQGGLWANDTLFATLGQQLSNDFGNL